MWKKILFLAIAIVFLVFAYRLHVQANTFGMNVNIAAAIIFLFLGFYPQRKKRC